MLLSHGQFDFVIVQCIIETVKVKCMLTPPPRTPQSNCKITVVSEASFIPHQLSSSQHCFIQDDMVLFNILRPD